MIARDQIECLVREVLFLRAELLKTADTFREDEHYILANIYEDKYEESTKRLDEYFEKGMFDVE